VGDVLVGLDPGIRRTVAWLRGLGFNTTDSGDGRSKRNVDSNPEALWYAHVAMVVPGGELVLQAMRLAELLRARGIELPNPSEVDGVAVHASFNPADGIAMLFMTGVDDEMLAKCPKEPT
jgi:hypothetical protein